MMTMLMMCVAMTATALSFWGLCEFARDRLKAEDAFAPSVVASLIMVTLTVAGIARVLLYAWWAVFAGGLVYLAISLVRRRLRLNWALVALGALAVYAFIHFRKAYYTGNDSVSHWGLVVRHLLTENRFPDATSKLVFFKSYPLGSTSFVYFLCRGFDAREGQYLAAMFMLYPIYLMPICGAVKRNRLLGYLTGAALLVVLVFVAGSPMSLQVDNLLGFMTIGGIATVACHRDDPQRAMWLALPTVAALVVVKASGLFLALVVLSAVVWVARGAGLPWRGKQGAARMLLVGLAAALVMFLLWQGHVRLTFGMGNMGKHSLSLSSYASMASRKSLGQIVTIAKRMAKWLIWPFALQRRIRVLWLTLYAACYLAIRLWRPEKKKWLRALGRTVLASLVLYLIWYGLLFIMFIVSMPIEEALEIASVGRYEGTMRVVVMGLQALFIASCFCDEALVIGRRAYVCAVAALLALLCVPIAGLFGGRSLAAKIIKNARVTQQPFKSFLQLKRSGEIEKDKSYLIFTRHTEHAVAQVYYLVKYEMQTLDIAEVATGIDENGLGRSFELNGYYLFDGIHGNEGADVTDIDDMEAFFDAQLPKYDYLILFSEDATFESAIEAYQAAHETDIRVLRSY